MTTVHKARIAERLPAKRPLNHPPRFGLQERLRVADRMLGPRGILPDTRLGIILSRPAASGHQLSEIVRDILTFARERHEATSDIITNAVKEIESLSDAEVISRAQIVINRLYHEKIVQSNNARLQADFPSIPTVEAFARLSSNGHFDPYQYFSSEGWGGIKIRLDYGKTIGYEQALTNFDLSQKLKDVLVVTRAFELLS